MDTSRRQNNQGPDNQKNNGSQSILQLIVHWFRRSFEYRGKASARKLTVFIAFCLLVTAFVDHLYSKQTIQVELLIIFSIIVLLGLGFLTAENIVEIFRARFGQSNYGESNYNSYVQNPYYDRFRVDNPDTNLQDGLPRNFEAPDDKGQNLDNKPYE